MFSNSKKFHFNAKIWLWVLVIGITAQSCYKDRFEFDKIAGGIWNPNAAVPLIYGDLSMSDVVKNNPNFWIEDSDGLLSLIYRGDTVSRFSDQVIQFPDQSFDTSLYVSIPSALFPGDSTSKILLLTPQYVGSNGERIDSILIKSGTLHLEFYTNLNHQGYVEIIIPDLTKYGITFIHRINISGSGSTNVVKDIPIYDYFLKTKQQGGKSVVEEYVKVMIRRGNSSNNSPYTFTIQQSIKNLTYYQAHGFFNQYQFDINETSVNIDVFDNIVDDQILFEDPKLRLYYDNSYGFPVDMTFTKFYVSKGSTNMNITSPLLPTLTLNYPTQFGTSASSVFIFDNTQSNIKDVVNLNPEKLVYAGYARSNPLGSVMPNFISDTSNVRVGLELELPMHGRAIKYTLQDTSELNIGNPADYDELVSLDLNINALNYFPIEAVLQLYLADSNGVVFDSLFTGMTQIIKAATPGSPPSYRVTTPIHHMVTVKLSEKKLTNFLKAKKMVVSAKANTIDSGSKIVKIYSDYKISYEISAKGEYKTNF
jgi:hypothetical protein